MHRIDGGSNQKQRSDVIRRFSPYYNGFSSAELAAAGQGGDPRADHHRRPLRRPEPQDATRLINYDLHWNPVRLMQRIGRVDRRMNPEIEARIVADHPELKELRGKVAFWNFLPPDELDELLRLFQRVTNKVLVISRTLGIEGRTLLTPDDDFDPIKEINEQCDGKLSEAEQLRLEYIALAQAVPGAGRDAGEPAAQGLFRACVAQARRARACSSATASRGRPGPIDTETGQPRWSDRAGFTVWLCYDLEGNRILTEPGAIASLIRSEPDTPRHCAIDRNDAVRAAQEGREADRHRLPAAACRHRSV